MIETQPTSGTRIVAASLLWILWGVSISPIVALFLEFGQGQLEDCGAEWWYHATSYPHFFIYPVTFGLAATVFLHRPWIQVIHYLRSLSKPAKTRHFWLIVPSMLVVIAFMSCVEFSRAPQGSAVEKCGFTHSTEAARSLWDFAPDAMKGEEGERVRDLVEKQCSGPPLTPEEKCEFGEEMANLWEADDRRSSYTGGVYYVGFVAMTSLFVVLFAAIAIVRSQASKPESDPESRRIAGMLLLALSFAAGWVVLRIAHLLEKSFLYPEDPQLAFDILIFGIFGVFFLHGAASRWSRIARHDRILKWAIFIISIVAFFAIRHLDNSQRITTIEDFLVQGIPPTAVAWLLFRFAGTFPLFLAKLFRQGVLRTILAFEWWIPGAFLVCGGRTRTRTTRRE